MWLVALDGSHAERLPQSREIPRLGMNDVSPDGRRVLVAHTERTQIQLYELDLALRGVSTLGP